MVLPIAMLDYRGFYVPTGRIPRTSVDRGYLQVLEAQVISPSGVCAAVELALSHSPMPGGGRFLLACTDVEADRLFDCEVASQRGDAWALDELDSQFAGTGAVHFSALAR